MSYYIDQLAEQDRQKRLADLLAMQQDNNEPGVQFDTPQQPIPQQGSLSDLMNSGASRDQINAMLSQSTMTSPGFDAAATTGRGEPYMPPEPGYGPAGMVEQAPLNSIRNNTTGVVTDLSKFSRPQHDVYRDGPQVLKEFQNPDGTIERFVKKPTTDGFGRQSTVVIRETVTPDYLNPAKLKEMEFNKQRAELAQLQAKPLSEYDKTMQQERAKRDIFASMPPSMREAEEVKRLGIKLKPGERYNMEKSEIELIPGSAPYNKQAGEVREESIGLKGLNRVIGNMLDRVDAVEKAPGLSSAVGFWDAATPALASGWNAEDKATARSYITNLQEYLETKGLADLRASGVAPGSITEKEWSKFRTMVGNIDPTMDEKSFQKELNNLKQYAANARAEAAAKEAALKKQYGPMWEKYAVSAETAPAAPVEQSGIVRVKSVNDAMKLKSGTRFIDPNGVERVRP